jgi:hypothetical protein
MRSWTVAKWSWPCILVRQTCRGADSPSVKGLKGQPSLRCFSKQTSWLPFIQVSTVSHLHRHPIPHTKTHTCDRLVAMARYG